MSKTARGERAMTDIEREVQSAFREEADELLRRIERALHEATGELEEDGLASVRRCLHTLKGAAAAVGHVEVELVVHGLEERLERPTWPAGSGHRLVPELLESIAQLRASLELRPLETEDAAAVELPEAPSSMERPATRRPVAAGHLKIRPERIDNLHARVGEVSVAMLSLDSSAQAFEVACASAAAATERCKRIVPLVSALRRELPASVYATLLDAARASLAAAHQAERATKLAVHASKKACSRLATTVADVREDAHGLRLQPVHPFFEEFAGLVAEAARDSGKRARLEIRAHDVEIDRGVLGRLREPLIHLLRNAVVHGIEPEIERA
ncbi:MAG: Hpt domain-containing protein, partial [Polyangiaceae bacterium]|nr:Hpt domain-containing protein [Polyangiaceae bacterium]